MILTVTKMAQQEVLWRADGSRFQGHACHCSGGLNGICYHTNSEPGSRNMHIDVPRYQCLAAVLNDLKPGA